MANCGANTNNSQVRPCAACPSHESPRLLTSLVKGFNLESGRLNEMDRNG